MKKRTVAALVPAATVAGIAPRDIVQAELAFSRNFPVMDGVRYLPESVGPQLRQYIITSNDDERVRCRGRRPA